MTETTLVYIEKDECYLLLHRIRKKNDINEGKWIGVGGKFEIGESPEECMRREVREETGLEIDEYRYCGIVTFLSRDRTGTLTDGEYMHLFKVTGFHGQPHTCDEGTLEWVPKKQMTQLPHWAGDRIFLSLIADVPYPFFSLKLEYTEGELTAAVLNEHRCLVTDRLVLRPWLGEDARPLYIHAKNPKVSDPAGWRPHTDIRCSRQVIRDVLSRPETYAIVPCDVSEPVGSVSLQNFTKEGTAELGYWIAQDCWNQGYATEAGRALVRHAFDDLGLTALHATCYLENVRSLRVLEKLGFRRDHIVYGEYVTALAQRRNTQYMRLDAAR